MLSRFRARVLGSVPILSGPIGGGDPPTCVDVVGQPQITLIDFNELTGASFVTGAQGLCFFVPDATTGFYPWFNTGTENTSILGSNPAVEVDISPTASDADIAAAAVSAINGSIYSEFFTTSQVDAGGTGTGLLITTIADVSYVLASDGFTGSYKTGAAFSQTQPGYPSAHICTPTSDALAGISFAFRGQYTYLGVTNNAGGLAKPGYTTQDLSGNQLLFQDSAMTIPAVNQGDTVAAIFDPISGLAAIQASSMLCPTLQFGQNALGMLVPYLQGNGTSTFLQNSSVSSNTSTFAVFTSAASASLRGGAFNIILSYGENSPGAGTIWNGQYTGTNVCAVSNSESDLKSSIADNLPHVYTIQYSGGNMTGRIDGSSIGTVVSGPRIGNVLYLGGYAGLGDNWNGRSMGEFVYDGTLSGEQITDIEEYLDSLNPA